MEYFITLTSIIVTALLSLWVGNIMYYKQAKIETRWKLLMSIKEDIYTSKKIACQCLDEFAIIFKSANQRDNVEIDIRNLQNLINGLTERKNSIYMYQLLYEQTLSKHKFKEKIYYPGSSIYRKNREFTEFLKNIWHTIDSDIHRLQNVHNLLNKELIKYSSNIIDSTKLTRSIIEIINQVHASDYKTYQIDEIALYQFMNPTFKQII